MNTPASTELVSRARLAVAGAVAAGVAVATVETPHLFTGAPSLVLAVADRMVADAPGSVVRAAIASLGTADKPALLAGVVAVAILAGAGLGLVARRRWWVAPIVMAVVALGAVTAEAARPSGSPWSAAMIGAAGVAVGAAALRWLLALAVPVHPRAKTVAGVAALGRRRFLVGAGSLAVLAVMPVLVSRSVGRGLRAATARARVVLPRASRPVAAPGAAASFPELGSIVTASRDFYRIDTALEVPDVDPSTWQLRVRGMVERPFTLTYDELLGMPLVEEYVTLCCVSNETGDSLIGNAAWLGVPLSTLLDRAGVQAGATQVVGRSVDGFTVGFPTAVGLDGRTALVAVGMNGEPLPIVHGFPARLVVAGLYGYVSATKWLAEIELTTLDAVDGYWIPRGWAKQAPIKTQSRIDVVGAGRAVGAGPVVVAGVAWAPARGVSRVEVQVDDGPWEPAELTAPLSAETWVQWRRIWTADAGRHRIRVRATDGRGQLQDSQVRPPAPDGATGYHTIVVDVG